MRELFFFFGIFLFLGCVDTNPYYTTQPLNADDQYKQSQFCSSDSDCVFATNGKILRMCTDDSCEQYQDLSAAGCVNPEVVSNIGSDGLPLKLDKSVICHCTTPSFGVHACISS